jgi:mutator protein MutT
MPKQVKEARETKATEATKVARTTPTARAARTAKPPKIARRQQTGKKSPTVIEVGAAIIQRQGRYLVSQRPEGSHLGPCWEFPGGKREAGETIEECVVREVREELGVEVSVGKLWRVIQRAFPDRVVKLHFFMCAIESGTPRAIGCQHFRWILPSEFTNYDFPPADLDIIQDLARKALRLQAAPA